MEDKEYRIEGIISKKAMDTINSFGDIFVIQLETVERPCCKECGHTGKSIQAFKQSKYNVYAIHTEATKTKIEMSVLMESGESNTILYIEDALDGDPYITERDNIMIKLTNTEADKVVKELNKVFYGDNWTLKRRNK